MGSEYGRPAARASQPHSVPQYGRMEAGIAEGVRLFNSEKFFEAHEALEAVWLTAQGDEKTILHGLIQVAAAFHHHKKGNAKGFRGLLEKGSQKLERFGGTRADIDVNGLLAQLGPWRAILREHALLNAIEHPPLPRIKIAPPQPSP